VVDVANRLNEDPVVGRSPVTGFFFFTNTNRQRRPNQASIRLVNDNKQEFANQVRRCALDLAQHGVSALGGLYDLTADRLVRYTCVITRNQEDAEDAMQAAMVRIANKPGNLASARTPWPYFVRVARNEALKIVQKRRSNRSLSVLFEPAAKEAHEAEEDDNRAFIRRAIARLPKKQAEVVVLKVWENLTFSEVAEVLDESPNTIASRYRYALQKLTEVLQPVRW
jgi:RNA polymerase sigma-70 factor (ECF subfamily)